MLLHPLLLAVPACLASACCCLSIVSIQPEALWCLAVQLLRVIACLPARLAVCMCVFHDASPAVNTDMPGLLRTWTHLLGIGCDSLRLL